MKSTPALSEAQMNARREREQKILKARARELARPLKDQQADEEMIRVVEFRLAQERYAVDQRYVQGVHPLTELTPLPCTPKFVAGLINRRGQIMPVIDVKQFFDLPETGITDLHIVIIVHSGEIELGLLADAITGVKTVPVGSIQRSLPTLTGIRAQYLMGVTSERTVILDVPAILSDPKLAVNEEAET